MSCAYGSKKKNQPASAAPIAPFPVRRMVPILGGLENGTSILKHITFILMPETLKGHWIFWKERVTNWTALIIQYFQAT